MTPKSSLHRQALDAITSPRGLVEGSVAAELRAKANNTVGRLSTEYDTAIYLNTKQSDTANVTGGIAKAGMLAVRKRIVALKAHQR